MATKYFCDRCGEEVPHKSSLFFVSLEMGVKLVVHGEVCQFCKEEGVQLFKDWMRVQELTYEPGEEIVNG